MNTSPSTSTPLELQSAPMAVRRVLQLLEKMEHGTLTVQFPDRSTKVFGKSSSLHAAISLQNWNVFTASLKSGDIGFAETYIAGDWSTPSLSDLLRVMIQNRRVVDELIFGTWWGRMAYRIKHLLNRNHKANSRKNIHAHYDLGNAFYELMLPHAALRLTQAAGRLLRTEQDSGVVTILDARLTTKAYGRKLIAALPPFRWDPNTAG